MAEKSCPKCTFTTRSILVLKQHTRKAHPKDPNFACTSCSFRTTSSHRLKIHEKLHSSPSAPDSENSQDEDEEDDGSTESSDDKPPAKSKTMIPVYHCPDCTYWSRRLPKFHEHILSHKTEPSFKCSVCDFSHRFRTSVMAHIRKKLKEGGQNPHTKSRAALLHPVPADGYSAHLSPASVPEGALSGWKELDDAGEHSILTGPSLEKKRQSLKRGNGESSPQVFLCHCGYWAKQKSKFHEHYVTHGSVPPFQCSVQGCGFRAKSSIGVRRHIPNAHKGVTARPVIIPIPDDGYATFIKKVEAIPSGLNYGRTPLTPLQPFPCAGDKGAEDEQNELGKKLKKKKQMMRE